MTPFSSASASVELLASPWNAPSIGRSVRLWLFGLSVLVLLMVVVGGATRLTGSGLSITEWKPLLGALPPLNEAAWQEAFEKYRHIPQYEHVNKGMMLPEFRAIYWWEWGHRLLGRFIGLYFFIPFVAFLAFGHIKRAHLLKIGVLFVLGAAQGALGWFMVKSGLADRVDVSQYRLAAHLALAVAIAGYAWWLTLSLGDRRVAVVAPVSSPLTRIVAMAIAGLIYLQIVAGAFVAGLKAGHASNTWPLMNGALIPSGAFELSPQILNLFENPLGAQLVHRLLAYLVALVIAGEALRLWTNPVSRRLRTSVTALVFAVGVQIALGVATIVYNVPLSVALLHQANAIILLALALWHVRRSLDEA